MINRTEPEEDVVGRGKRVSREERVAGKEERVARGKEERVARQAVLRRSGMRAE